MIRCALLLFFAHSAVATPALEQTLRDYASPSAVESMKMSPDGRKLAFIAPQGDYESMLVMVDAETLKPIGALRSEDRRLVGDFWWVGDNRLVAAVAEKFGGFDQPFLTGVLIAVNADGRQAIKIYGSTGEQQVGTRTKTRANETEHASMVEPLPGDSKRAIIAITPRGREKPYTELFVVDVDSGQRKRIARAPIAHASFLVDADGQPRYAWSNDTAGWHRLYERSEGDRWVLVNDESETGFELEPWAISADGQGLTALMLGPSGPGKVVEWSSAGGIGRTLYEARVAEPLGAVLSADGRRAIGVLTAEDRMALHLVEPDGSEARALTALQAGFPGALLVPHQWSLDGRLALVEVLSDRNSGEYFLYDSESRNARFLLARDEWLDPDSMQPRLPITVEARDGLALHGYLTPARGVDGPAPMVVLPHGGPHGPRDHWSWDRWAQFLAGEGFSVLQINFRGSGGYGQAFMSAGYLKWGDAMQDDLSDALRWVIAEGHADAGRVCIFGSSYGGYAALMSAARDPSLYRCAISYVGVSDLNLMFNRGDIRQSIYGTSYLKRVLGEDARQRALASPVNHAEHIQAAVMLIHGGEDQRVPIDHANRMRKALEKAGKPVEWLVKREEGHGFYRQEHRKEAFAAVLAFLRKHTAKAD